MRDKSQWESLHCPIVCPILRSNVTVGFQVLQYFLRATLVVQTVKNLPAMQETQVQSLGREDPLEKEMATHSSILAWKIPWTEKPGEPWSMGWQRVRHD